MPGFRLGVGPGLGQRVGLGVAVQVVSIAAGRLVLDRARVKRRQLAVGDQRGQRLAVFAATLGAILAVDGVGAVARGEVGSDVVVRRLLALLVEAEELVAAARYAAQVGLAVNSGFRASELALLVPLAFDLEGEGPVVTLGADKTKNGKAAIQPLPQELAEALKGYLNGRPEDAPVWPGNWADDAAKMLRIDLDAAGVPYVVEGPDGPLFADFHALRHTFIALLDRAGATLKEAMQLARHSDPKLTMAVYGRAQLHDLQETVGRLPDTPRASTAAVAARLGATGTEGNPTRARGDCAKDRRRSGTGTEGEVFLLESYRTGESGCVSVRLSEKPRGMRGRNRTGLNPLKREGLRPVAMR